MSAAPLSPTPAELGFSMPAEWEPHAATWLSWPNERGATFPGELLPPILPAFHRLVGALVEGGERVVINVSDAAERAGIEAALTAETLARVSFLDNPTNEPWCRDHGPTVLRRPDDGARLAVHWNYNSWGGKYAPWDLDAAAGRRMAEAAGVDVHDRTDLTIEGGSLESNGEGVLMVSESSVVTESRNPGRSRDELAAELCASTGSREVLWVNADVPGDDTDGHVDCYARFAPGGRLVILEPSEDQAEEYPSLAANARHLRSVAAERGWEVTGLPIPAPVHIDGAVMPSTYANYYIANSAVLVPAFEDPADEVAAALIAAAYPDRKVIVMPARELIWGQGGFHCLTQQLPA
ncbi:MAG: agmatine deiminase family protein [Verrucomicrobiae bacterium]|nr:agmatine deiminase family protein [Verrucomicrobiae bacterium]